jgi:hypothetical protein
VKKFFLIIFLIGTFACTKNKPAPEHLLSKEKMVSILIDVYIAEGKVNSLDVKTDSMSNLFAAYEKHIFQKHEVTDSIYRESYQWYLEDIIAMDQIYSAVVDSLSLRERTRRID